MELSFLGAGGLMGLPIVTHVINSSSVPFKLTLWNRTRSKIEHLKQDNVDVVDTAAEAVGAANIIVFMLFNAQQALDILEGDVALKGKLIVGMSTVSPSQSLEIQAACEQKGAQYFESPDTTAVAAQLKVLCSGSKETFDMLTPFFSCFGTPRLVGAVPPTSAKLKLIMNQMILGVCCTFFTSLSMAKKCGLENEFMETLTPSPFFASYMGFKHDTISKDEYTPPHFSTVGALKDVTLMRELAIELEIRDDMLVAIQDIATNSAQQFPEEDFAALFKTIMK